jgi:hypothetical protein
MAGPIDHVSKNKAAFSNLEQTIRPAEVHYVNKDNLSPSRSLREQGSPRKSLPVSPRKSVTGSPRKSLTGSPSRFEEVNNTFQSQDR